ncbi:MAG: CBS domain-containing protein [Geminicoccaceae bacterium]
MITAAELMTRDVLYVMPDMPVAEVAQLILTNRISALPVVDQDRKLLGIVGEGDLVRSASARDEPNRSWWLVLLAKPKNVIDQFISGGERRVDSVMSRDVLMASEQETLPRLVELLSTPRIKRLPIVNDGKLVGIVSRLDILRYLSENKILCAFPR